jgi:AhpC/TSA family
VPCHRLARRRFLIIALGCLLAGPSAGAQELRLTGMAGEQLKESDLGTGITIAVVWASWSPRSRNIVERVKPLVSRWGAQARVVTLNFEEDRRTVEIFLAGKSFGAPVFLDADGAFAKRYGIATLPGLLVVRDGKVAYHGKLPDEPDRVLAELLR